MKKRLLILGTTAAVTAAATMASRDRRERVSGVVRTAAKSARTWRPRRNGSSAESETAAAGSR